MIYHFVTGLLQNDKSERIQETIRSVLESSQDVLHDKMDISFHPIIPL